MVSGSGGCVKLHRLQIIRPHRASTHCPGFMSVPGQTHTHNNNTTLRDRPHHHVFFFRWIRQTENRRDDGHDDIQRCEREKHKGTGTPFFLNFQQLFLIFINQSISQSTTLLEHSLPVQYMLSTTTATTGYYYYDYYYYYCRPASKRRRALSHSGHHITTTTI